MFRMRGLARNGALTDLVLLAVFLTLAYIFLARRGYMQQVDQALSGQNQIRDLGSVKESSQFDINAPKLVPEKAEALTQDEKAQEKINLIVSRIKDVRSESCKSADFSAQVPCSIILHFYYY